MVTPNATPVGEKTIPNQNLSFRSFYCWWRFVTLSKGKFLICTRIAGFDVFDRTWLLCFGVNYKLPPCSNSQSCASCGTVCFFSVNSCSSSTEVGAVLGEGSASSSNITALGNIFKMKSKARVRVAGFGKMSSRGKRGSTILL